MRIVTAAEARKNLNHLLKSAKLGEDIGIVYGDHVIALRLVFIQAQDYCQAEYGASPAQMAAFTRRMNVELNSKRRTGSLQLFTGKTPARARVANRPKQLLKFELNARDIALDNSISRAAARSLAFRRTDRAPQSPSRLPGTR
jgi:antitoxin (DNA-binding transcriptional repressor) of toxin-antitoxin stability system